MAVGWQAYLSFLNRAVENGLEKEDERREEKRILQAEEKEGEVKETTT